MGKDGIVCVSGYAGAVCVRVSKRTLRFPRWGFGGWLVGGISRVFGMRSRFGGGEVIR